MAEVSKAAYPLFGIVPVINTPFREDGKVDLASVERLVRRSITEGIGGLLVNAVASEGDTLTRGERRDIIRSVIDLTSGNLPIVAGVSAQNLRDTVMLAEDAVRSGCPAVMCRLPDELVGQDEVAAAYFRAVAAVGMDVLMIQDLAWTGPGLSLRLIDELFHEIPAFRCLKVEVALAGPKYTAAIDATGGRLNVSCGGGMVQMIVALDRGGHAFMTTACNVPFVATYGLHKAGRRSEAIRLFNRVLPVLSWVQQDLGVSVRFFKEYCVRRGEFESARVRITGAAFDSHQARIANELLEDLLALETEIAQGRTALARATPPDGHA